MCSGVAQTHRTAAVNISQSSHTQDLLRYGEVTSVSKQYTNKRVSGGAAPQTYPYVVAEWLSFPPRNKNLAYRPTD
jgi:hypothetical protein